VPQSGTHENAARERDQHGFVATESLLLGVSLGKVDRDGDLSVGGPIGFPRSRRKASAGHEDPAELSARLGHQP
jgi:hypothetical protein